MNDALPLLLLVLYVANTDRMCVGGQLWRCD